MPSNPRRGPRTACSTAPVLVLYSSTKCGPCLAAVAEKAMTARLDVERMRAIREGNENLSSISLEHGEFLYELERRFPKTEQRFRKFGHEGRKSQEGELGRSGLRRELLPREADAEGPGPSAEDVASAMYYNDWSRPWDSDASSIPPPSDLEEGTGDIDLEDSGWNPMDYGQACGESFLSPWEYDRRVPVEQAPGNDTASEHIDKQLHQIRTPITDDIRIDTPNENVNPRIGEKAGASELHRRTHQSLPIRTKAGPDTERPRRDSVESPARQCYGFIGTF